jgi:hypothetical protein
MEGTDNTRTNQRLEPLGIAKIKGETIATASTLKNCLFSLHTEEATGSIPVSPTTLPRPTGSLSRVIRPRFRFSEGLVETALFWTDFGTSATLHFVKSVSMRLVEPS